MSYVNIKFIFNGDEVQIQARGDDYFKIIFEKFANKIKEEVNKFIFLYDGVKLNPNLKLREINNNISNIKIVAIINNNEDKEDKFIKSKYIICPICKRNSVIKMNSYKISLEECDEGIPVQIFY